MKQLNLLLFLGVLSSVTQAQCFSSSPPINLGSNPSSCVAAMLDPGNSTIDVAITNSNSNNVSVLLSNGNGTFQTQATYTVGNNPVGIASNDLDNNLMNDLVICNEGDNTITIIFFTPSGVSYQIIGVGQSPRSVAIGDINSDGNDDIVVANYLSNNISVIMNQGGQVFSPAQSINAGTAPVFIITTSLGGDAFMDIAVANYFSNDISLITGNGNGTFNMPLNFAVGSNPTSITGIFANQDIYPDFAVCNESSNNFTLLLSNGPLSYSMTNYTAGTSPTWITSGDFNGDTFSDIATANGTDVSFFLGSNNGSFAPPENYSLLIAPSSLAPADFNNDLKTDLFAAGSLTNDGLVIFNSSSGIFSSPVITDGGNFNFSTGDLNGDTLPDIIRGNVGASGDSIAVYLGNGDGTFQSATFYEIGWGWPKYSGIADFNGDGKNDVVVITDTYLHYFQGNGAGYLSSPTSINIYSTSGFYGSTLQIADFNTDNNLDVYISDLAGGIILFGDGAGGFPTNNPSAPWGNYVVGDFDHDGDIDLVGTMTNGLVINKNNGAGSFAYSTQTIPNLIGGAAVGYINNDSLLDLIAMGGMFTFDTLYVMYGNSNLTFQNPIKSPAGNPNATYSRLVTGDFNNDSIIDIIYSSISSNQATFFQEGLGNGLFAPQLILPSSANWQVNYALTTDFDNNTLIDYAHSTSGDFRIYFNCSVVPPSAPPSNVPEIYGGNRIIIYPNPSPGQFTITAKGQLIIYNMLGEKIFSQKLLSQENAVNIDGVKAGVYFMQIHTEDAVFFEKVVIQ